MTSLSDLKEKCRKALDAAETSDIWNNELWLICYEVRDAAAQVMNDLAARRWAEHHRARAPLADFSDEEIAEAFAAIRGTKWPSTP